MNSESLPSFPPTPVNTPSRSGLRRWGKFIYPLAGFTTIVLSTGIFLPVFGWFFVLLWAMLVALYAMVLVDIDYPNQRGFWRALRNQLYGLRVGFLGVFGGLGAIFAVALNLREPQPVVAYLWPIVLFPLGWLMSHYRDRRYLTLTRLMVVLTVAVGLLLYASEVFAMHSRLTIDSLKNCLVILQGGAVCEQAVASLPSIWFMYISLVTYYLIHQGHLYRTREVAIRNVIREIGSTLKEQVDDVSMTKILQYTTRQVHRLHKRNIVTVVTCERGDPSIEPSAIPNGTLPDRAPFAYNRLKIVANLGVASDVWRQVPSWPATIGLTGIVVRDPQHKPVLQDNITDQKEYFQPKGWPTNIRSEMVVPIEAGGMLYGAIDLQSSAYHDFTQEDRETISAIAKPLAAVFLEEGIASLYRAVEKMWQQLSKLQNEQKMIECFGEYASEHAGVDIVSYYPLAIGTGYPRTPPMTFGFLREPSEIKVATLRAGSPVLKLVAEWTPRYQPDAQSDSTLRSLIDVDLPAFVQRENIHSMCFMPLAYGNDKIGALFLNYRARESFGPARRLAINALSQALALHVARARYNEPSYTAFTKPRFRLHHILNKRGLGKDRLAGEFEELMSMPSNIADKLESLKARLLAGYEEAYLDDSVIDIDFESADLATQLDVFAGEVKQLYIADRPDLRIVPRVDSAVDNESSDLRMILMAVATEAAINAIYHAKATRIDIEVRRLQEAVTLRVGNDDNSGKVFAPEASQHSKHGIFELLRQLRIGMCAHAAWRILDGEGTQLEIYLPALPLKKAHYV